MVTNGITYGVTSIQSESVSYTKDGKLTTVKNALDELITKSSKVDDLEKKVTDYEKKVHYLADKVQIGEYVAYDAGTWGDATGRPTEQEQFGGNAAHTNKGASVEWCWMSNYKTTLQGWRVLSKDEKTKTVTIVHAGQPECYKHQTDQNNSIDKLNNRANEYKNSYAESAHAMTEEEARGIEQSNNLRTTGDCYWLANAYSSNNLVFVNMDGDIGHYNGRSYGFRPVIVLKSSVLTTGEGRDSFGNKAWILA